MIVLSYGAHGPHECEIEGCERHAVYRLSFGYMERRFCDVCLARRVTELLLFD